MRRGRLEGCGEARKTVLPPMTTWLAWGAKLIGVPSTVSSDPPGLSVFPSTENCKREFAVIVLDPIVRTGRVAESSWTGTTGVGLGEFDS